MTYITQHRWVHVTIAGMLLGGLLLVALAGWQVAILHKAHSSFTNYAAFRGCTTITSQSNASGTCTLASGQTITMVQFRGRWYLAGDLPACWGSMCL